MALLSRLNEIFLKNKKEENKPEIVTQIETLVNYFNIEYKTGNISTKILKQTKDLLPKLKTYNPDGDDNDSDTSYIKIGDKKYKIDSQETDENGNLTSIKLAGEISEPKSLIIKLKKHPWVQDENKLTEEFQEIWNNYLKNITGFIVYNGNTLELLSPEDIKKNFSPSRVVQNQISIAKNR